MKNSYALKQFQFSAGKRSDLIFSDATKVRLCPQTEYTLVPKFSESVEYPRTVDSLILIHNTITDLFPMDTDITVTTWNTTPIALRAFVGFALDAVIPTNTTVTFQLMDAGSPVYWTGAAWAAAGATNWNTETEVQTGITTFAPIGKQFGVKIKLYTSDGADTPYVYSVNFVMQIFASQFDDLLYRTIIPALKTIRINTPVVITMTEDSTTVDISKAMGDKTYLITDCIAAYLYSDTINETDIFDSYTAGVVTFTSEQTEDTVIKLYVEVGTTAIVQSQSEDFTALPNTLPCFVVDGFSPLYRRTVGDTSIINQSVPWGARLSEGKAITFLVECVANSGSGIDNLAMYDAVQVFFSENKFLTLPSIDERIAIVLTADDIEMSKTLTANELHGINFNFKVFNFPFYGSAEIDADVVQELVLTGTLIE